MTKDTWSRECLIPVLPNSLADPACHHHLSYPFMSVTLHLSLGVLAHIHCLLDLPCVPQLVPLHQLAGHHPQWCADAGCGLPHPPHERTQAVVWCDQGDHPQPLSVLLLERMDVNLVVHQTNLVNGHNWPKKPTVLFKSVCWKGKCQHNGYHSQEQASKGRVI